MVPFDIENPIKEGNQVNWLMDDATYQSMVVEFLRQHPIRYMQKGKLGAIICGGVLTLLVFTSYLLEYQPENPLVHVLVIITGLLLLSFPVILLLLLCYNPSENNPLSYHREELLQRICEIPFVLDYTSMQSLETSDGIMRNYRLSLSDKNDDGCLRKALDLADFQFALDRLPRQSELTLMAIRISITEITRGDDDRPLVHVRIRDWIEVGNSKSQPVT